jgi:hypothetical protein
MLVRIGNKIVSDRKAAFWLARDARQAIGHNDQMRQIAAALYRLPQVTLKGGFLSHRIAALLESMLS